jgi:hypothetical protein
MRGRPWNQVRVARPANEWTDRRLGPTLGRALTAARPLAEILDAMAFVIGRTDRGSLSGSRLGSVDPNVHTSQTSNPIMRVACRAK